MGITRNKIRSLPSAAPLLLVGAAFYAFLMHPFLLLAQETEIDLVAPKILHARPFGVFSGGEAIEIVATVTDSESGVADVRLFFRSKGKRNYEMVRMTPEVNDRYRAMISGEVAQDPGVEYYLEAEDRAGNRVQTLRPPDLFPALVEIKSPSAWERFRGDDKPWYKKPWVWTVAGAVVLGAASMGGGGGGGGSGGGAGAPTTGTITVDGPVP